MPVTPAIPNDPVMKDVLQHETEFRELYKDFKEQNLNDTNSAITDRLDRFDPEEYPNQGANYFTEKNGIEYFNHAKSLPNSELNVCALRGLKLDANIAMNKLALDPDNQRCNREFHKTQRALRDWRGKYITKESVFTFTGPKNDDNYDLSKPGQDHSYRVVFSLTKTTIPDKDKETAEDIKNSSKLIFCTSADLIYKDIELEKMIPEDIINIINKADLEKIDDLGKTDGNMYNAAQLKQIIQKIKNDLPRSGHTWLGDNYKQYSETSRYSWEHFAVDREISHNHLKHRYNMNVNKIFPTKSRIYHNPKVVQKMICDILRLPFQTQHLDLTVTEPINELTLQWTIHRISPDAHTVTHVTFYDHRTDGFYNLPDDLTKIRGPMLTEPDESNFTYHANHIESEDINLFSLKFNSKEFNIHDEIKWLDLHAQLARESRGHIGSRDSNVAQDNIAIHRNVLDGGQYAYVYEYGAHTIIANSLNYKPSPTRRANFTSYTIIHWNFKHSGSHGSNNYGMIPYVNTKMQQLEQNISYIQHKMKSLPALEYNAGLVDNTVIDYFIPAILADMKYAEGDSYVKRATFVNYRISSPTLQQRVLLESKRYELEIKILPIILEHYKEQDVKVKSFEKLRNIVHRDLLTTEEEDMLKQRTKPIQVLPGYFATLLMRTHDCMGSHTPETEAKIITTMVPYVKKWTVEWTEYLKKMKISFVK